MFVVVVVVLGFIRPLAIQSLAGYPPMSNLERGVDLGINLIYFCFWSGGSRKTVTSEVGVAFVWNFL